MRAFVDRSPGACMWESFSLRFSWLHASSIQIQPAILFYDIIIGRRRERVAVSHSPLHANVVFLHSLSRYACERVCFVIYRGYPIETKDTEENQERESVGCEKEKQRSIERKETSEKKIRTLYRRWQAPQFKVHVKELACNTTSSLPRKKPNSCTWFVRTANRKQRKFERRHWTKQLTKQNKKEPWTGKPFLSYTIEIELCGATLRNNAKLRKRARK